MWFAKKAKSVTTLEGNLEWMNYVKSIAPQNVDMRHLTKDNRESILTENEKFDLVLVDGDFRPFFIDTAPDLLANEKGIIIVDYKVIIGRPNLT